MPTRARIIHFDLFAMHAHIDDQHVDYGALVTAWARALHQYHSEFENHRNIAIPRTALLDGKLSFVAYTGYSTANILFFDVNKQVEENQANLPGRFQARKTHVLIDGTTRKVVIEARYGGLTASDLSLTLESSLRSVQGYEELEVDLNPIPSSAFLDGIERFTRVQSAKAVVARPNFDWTDFNNKLTDIGADSEAASLELAAQARRGKSLARNNGILEFIKEAAAAPVAILKNALVTGSEGNNGPLITLNLSKNVQRRSVAIPADANGSIDDEEARRKMAELVNPN